MITLDLRPSSSNDFNIYQTTTLPRCLLVMDLVKTCRADGCCKRLVWLAGGFRPSSHEGACGSDKLLLFFSPRWSLPLDHLCLRRNSRISWWNSAFTINHIFFASSHSKYLLSLAWSQHCSNMSCTSKRVSNQGTGTEQPGAREAKDSTRGPAAWPTRDRHLPRWLAGQNWAR